MGLIWHNFSIYIGLSLNEMASFWTNIWQKDLVGNSKLSLEIMLVIQLCELFSKYSFYISLLQLIMKLWLELVKFG